MIPQPAEQLLHLQPDCCTARERAKYDSAAGPEAKQDGDRDISSAVTQGTYTREYAIRSGLYLSDKCSTCITYTVERQVEWQEVFVGRPGCRKRWTNQASAFNSYPVISQRQVSEAGSKKHMTLTALVCRMVCKYRKRVFQHCGRYLLICCLRIIICWKFHFCRCFLLATLLYFGLFSYSLVKIALKRFFFILFFGGTLLSGTVKKWGLYAVLWKNNDTPQFTSL